MIDNKMIVDYFCGAGGASEGIRKAFGVAPDLAINHSKDAIAMHSANHPNTHHLCEDAFMVDPVISTYGKKILLCWLSPDCKHFSKAKGKAPVDQKIRGLAWVTIRWAASKRPDCIMLENVEEFKTWGPLDENGEPDKKRAGEFFDVFIGILTTGTDKHSDGFRECLKTLEIKENSILAHKLSKGLGYDIEFRELSGCDYGAPTTRKRLFMIMRSDGKKIVWPEPTHGKRDSLEVAAGLLKPYRTAAECINWNIPSRSIFGRKKDLVPNTLRRIVKGIKKFVTDNPDPFIVKVNHSGDQFRGQSIYEPLGTLTAKNGFALVVPTMIQVGYGDSEGNRSLDLHKPLGTVTAGGRKFAFATAWIRKDYNTSIGDDISEPFSTITSRSNHHSLMLAHLRKSYNWENLDLDDELEIFSKPNCLRRFKRSHLLLRTNVGNSLEVEQLFTKYGIDSNVQPNSSFLVKYYGSDVGQSLNEPLHTVPTKDRFGIVILQGERYRITDITFRMIEAEELARSHNFSESYIFDMDQYGNKLAKYKQVNGIGNSVLPDLSEALCRANFPEYCVSEPVNEQIELLNADFGWSG